MLPSNTKDVSEVWLVFHTAVKVYVAAVNLLAANKPSLALAADTLQVVM